MTLKKFMEQVKQAHCFIQIHRSYAINMVNEESKNELEIVRKYLMDKF